MATECIRWSDYSSSVSASFCQFWEDELFTDVTVAVPGGAAVAAHCAVLAARSAGLRRLLVPPAGRGGGQLPGPPPLLLLRGVSAGLLRQLLQLLYTGRVQAERSQLSELLELCRELEVEGLDAASLGPLEAGDGRQAAVSGPAPDGWQAAASGPAAGHAAASSPPPPAEPGTDTADTAAAAAAGGGACWQPPPPPPPGGPPRPCTPVTVRADSDDEDRALGSSPEPTSSVTTEHDGGRQSGDDWRPAEPVGGAGCTAATFQHVSSLLEGLDWRQLQHLQQRADQIMHPDFTGWLPDELMVNILCRLSPRDLMVVAGVCRRWQRLAADGLLRTRFLGWTGLPLPPPKRLEGHESEICCMAVDGNRVVTGSSDKTVGIWSAASGRLTGRLRAESEVTCVQVEGDTVVAAGRDGSLDVWSAASGRRRHRLLAHDGPVWSLALLGGRAASGSDDKTVRFWEVLAGRQVASVAGHRTVVRAVCFDGSWVVSGDDAGRVQVWSAQRRAVEVVWHARSRLVVVLQHAHGLVVSGHRDGDINVWDLAARQLRYELHAHPGWLTDVCLSPGGQLLLAGCIDGTALLWHLSSGTRHRLLGHRQRITAVRLLPGLAVTGSWDGRVRLWNSGSGALVRDLVTPEVSGGPVKQVWVNPGRLVCGVQNNASDRPQVLVMDMGLRAAGGAAVGSIDVAAVRDKGGSGGAGR